MGLLWGESFPNVVDRANRYRAAGQWLHAGVEYLKAAHVAPTPAVETALLTEAWVCSERAGGRISEFLDMDS